MRIKTNKLTTYITVVMLVSVTIQLIFGNIDPHFFSMPLNLIIGIASIWLGYAISRNNSIQRKDRLTLSVSVITLMILSSAIIGLTVQLSTMDISTMNKTIAVRLGFYDFITSWIFAAVVFLFLSILSAIIFTRIKPINRHNTYFLLNHFGLWLALFSGFFGSADTRTVRLVAERSVTTNNGYEENGNSVTLPYTIQLIDFDIERGNNGGVDNYQATLSITNENIERQIVVRVNHPYAIGHDDIYLISYDSKSDNPQHCVLQIVGEPWQIVTFIGIFLMILGAVMQFASGVKNNNL